MTKTLHFLFLRGVVGGGLCKSVGEFLSPLQTFWCRWSSRFFKCDKSFFVCSSTRNTHLLRKLNSPVFIEGAALARGKFFIYWRHSKAVALTEADSRFVALGEAGGGERQQEDTCESFFTLYGRGVWKTGRISVTGEMKMYISVHTPRGIINFFLLFFFAEATSRVHFVTAFLGNVVMRKTKKCVPISPIPKKEKQKTDQKKGDSHCAVFRHGLWTSLFILGGNVCWKMVKWYRLSLSYWFCSEYEYCVLLCRNPENRVAKKKQ